MKFIVQVTRGFWLGQGDKSPFQQVSDFGDDLLFIKADSVLDKQGDLFFYVHDLSNQPVTLKAALVAGQWLSLVRQEEE